MTRISRATIDDLAFLERTERECFSDPWNQDMLVTELIQPLSVFYIMSVKGKQVGYFSYIHILDEAHIMNVAVLPEFQGMGYGRQMMSLLLKTASGNSISSITLEVRKSNFKAIALYESFGFVLKGTRKGYYSDGEDALIYWLYR